jgi:hypothetical protein
MRRVLFFMAAMIVATAAAVAVASASASTAPPIQKWFKASATAVAGPNHTVTLTVRITNVATFRHTGIVDVRLYKAGSGYSNLGPLFPKTVTVCPLHSWSFTYNGVALSPGVTLGIAVVASHVMEGNDPTIGVFPDVTASALVVSR